MESREGMNSRVTVIAHEVPSSYHVAPRIEKATALGIMPQEVMIPVVNNNNAGSSEKKKRGRPRKYAPDGTSCRPLSPVPLSSTDPPLSGNYLADNASSARHYSSHKKHKPKIDNLGEFVACTTGGSFLPHLLNVNAGEDVSTKIITFCQQGPRAVCIISAVGLISNVTLRQPHSSGGTLTYEGRFEILSLSGSFTPTDFGGSQYGHGGGGGMSISSASPDGRVVGGTLAGLLVAASHVQVVVGSFLPSNYNELKPKKHKYEQKAITGSSSTTPQTANMEHRNFNPQGLHHHSMTETQSTTPPSTLQTGNWATTMSAMGDSRKSSTDINIPLQGQ